MTSHRSRASRKGALGSGARAKRFCFLAYSSREAHATLFIECLEMVFKGRFEVKVTPSALESGASQRDVITELIKGCSFGVVLLDGLRANVIFEYGVMHGMNRPILLFKEKEANVDIVGLYGSPVELGVSAPPVNCDMQFSDVKDVNYTTWNRFSVKETVRRIWEEYRKKKGDIKNYVEIEEPDLCQ